MNLDYVVCNFLFSDLPPFTIINESFELKDINSMFLKPKTLKIKLYEVPTTSEKNVIAKLRKELFPKANKEMFWGIVAEWYSWLKPNCNQISISDAGYKTKYGKVNVKEIAIALNRHPIILHDSQYLETTFVLLPCYRFLFDNTLEPLRISKELFEALKEIKERDAKEHTSISYKADELTKRLGMKVDEPFEEKIRMLCDIGLLHCSSWSSGSSLFENATLNISIKPTEEYEEWYRNLISNFERDVNDNKREFWKKNKFLRWLSGKESLTDNVLVPGEISIQAQKPRILQISILILFIPLLGTTIYFASQANWPACGIFLTAILALLNLAKGM